MRKLALLAVAFPLLAGGCLHTVATVATAPIKVTSKAVDWTTTSQSEADRNYGRKMRKQEEREGKERKKAYKKCREQGGDDAQCRGVYRGEGSGYYR